ncbi:hypothetical protein GGR50DRAFT_680408 [Xylaria sp. CBS 124048]|nr:hypothetical protein GGR50DRAFT_680408 [Xylaria sp. CBS 124048]
MRSARRFLLVGVIISYSGTVPYKSAIQPRTVADACRIQNTVSLFSPPYIYITSTYWVNGAGRSKVGFITATVPIGTFPNIAWSRLQSTTS